MDVLIVLLVGGAVFTLSFVCFIRSGFERIKNDTSLKVLYRAIRFSAIWIVAAVAYAAIARELYFILLVCFLLMAVVCCLLTFKVNSKGMQLGKMKKPRFVMRALRDVSLVVAIGLAIIWLITLVL